ncbi:MAG TPA: hypothetical protein VF629_21250 [Hymenobacter sp.]|jgi:hypothetical protein|uniref:hypothetical protein n=1 Tax=Hymenobacter sp. TaxID=1898978 RepID=UPI002EDA3C49
MSRKLEKLIAYYEAERNVLTTQLAECMAEDDYASARRFSKGIRLVNQQLQTLLNLQDGRHDERERAVRLIQMFEKMKGAQAAGISAQLYAEHISAAQKRLAELGSRPVMPPTASKPTVLQAVLLKLLNKHIDSFTFVFSTTNRLSCVVKLVRRTSMITLLEVQRLREECLLEKKQIRSLKTLGFKLYDNGDKLIVFLPYTTAADVSALQYLLVKMAFEVFYFKEFTGQSCIKYWEIG